MKFLKWIWWGCPKPCGHRPAYPFTNKWPMQAHIKCNYCVFHHRIKEHP